MSEVVIVEGYKGIAALLNEPESSLRREANSYPDPLPVRQFGDDGRVWAKPERLRLHRLRHADGAQHPIAGLAIVELWERVAKLARLSIERARKLAPWVEPAVEDPLPVMHREDGTIWAYREALIDWLDRRSRTAGAPRYRRRWGGQKASAKRGRPQRKGAKKRARTLPESAGARSEQKAARVPVACQESSTERAA